MVNIFIIVNKVPSLVSFLVNSFQVCFFSSKFLLNILHHIKCSCILHSFQERHQNDIIDIILVFLLLNWNIFPKLFYWWPWRSKFFAEKILANFVLCEKCIAKEIFEGEALIIICKAWCAFIFFEKISFRQQYFYTYWFQVILYK